MGRPKRAGEVFARTHDQGGDEPSSKKPRFDARNPSTLAPDAPEDDAILELDEIGTGAQTKRNAVNLDGYDSDSDNDNFNARAEAKAKAQAHASKEEEDNDMFADLEEGDGDEDEELQVEGKKKKKDVRFLDVDEIQGQVENSTSGGHISADFRPGGKTKAADDESSSESGDDEERDHIGSEVDEEIGAGGKKKHAPRVDAFNMRSENEEGRFDETGNFVRKANDPEARHDAWMQGLSKKDIKRAREAQEKRDEERRKRALADDALLTSDLLGTLIQHLQKGEAVLEALQRLNKGRPQQKKKAKWQKAKRQDSEAMDVETAEEGGAESSRRSAVEAITGAADQLLTRGQTDIYEAERELLMRQYRGETGDEWAEEANSSSAGKQWEYRWADGREGGERHGPYDGQTMAAWQEAGYFAEGVEFCLLGKGEWTRTADF